VNAVGEQFDGLATESVAFAYSVVEVLSPTEMEMLNVPFVATWGEPLAVVQVLSV